MTDSGKREPLTLKRWSQRKLAAAREAQPPMTPATASPATADAAAPPSPPDAPPAQRVDGDSAQNELPPLDSLTIDSDFAAFMRPDVDESLKRGALRKLFSDPRFNVMDGLDVYIDDYSKPDPISPDVVRQLMQARYIFDPPATRITVEGHVEDVPADEAAQAPPAQPASGGELPAAGPAETLASTNVPTHAPEPSAAQPERPIAPGAESRSP